MRETITKVWLFIGLVVQSCLVSTVSATSLDNDPTHQQRINPAFKIQNNPYAETVVPDYMERELLQTSHTVGNLPHIQFKPHSNQPATPIDEWRSWQSANQVGQGRDETLYGEADPYSDYEDAYSGSTSITLGDVLQSQQGSSSSLIKSLLKSSLDEEQVAQLLSIREPWQDSSGTQHFSLFSVGDFVIENRPQSSYNNGHTAPGAAHQGGQSYHPPAAPAGQNRASSNTARASLKEQLYEWIDKTIGWPMLYLSIAVSGILILGASIIKFVNAFSIQQ